MTTLKSQPRDSANVDFIFYFSCHQSTQRHASKKVFTKIIFCTHSFKILLSIGSGWAVSHKTSCVLNNNDQSKQSCAVVSHYCLLNKTTLFFINILQGELSTFTNMAVTPLNHICLLSLCLLFTVASNTHTQCIISHLFSAHILKINLIEVNAEINRFKAEDQTDESMVWAVMIQPLKPPKNLENMDMLSCMSEKSGPARERPQETFSG